MFGHGFFRGLCGLHFTMSFPEIPKIRNSGKVTTPRGNFWVPLQPQTRRASCPTSRPVRPAPAAKCSSSFNSGFAR